VAEQTMSRPFLKWAGGKTQLLQELIRRVPPRIGTYHEPFVGGGALFFRLASDPALRPQRVVLNDLNAELITTFKIVRDSLDPLMHMLDEIQEQYLAREAEGRAEYFYSVRADSPEEPIEIAARLIFLNKTCFNGLYRVNRSGRFNVPHGRYQRPRILDRDALSAASAALTGVELRSVDFEEACKDAISGDLVYFDPPFHPLSETSSFTAYTENAFDRKDQLRLKWCIDDLREREVSVMLSNSPHQWVLGLYEGSRYEITRVSARRAINSQGGGRGPVDELTITSYPQIDST
jgi:DNA adenine methylase